MLSPRTFIEQVSLDLFYDYENFVPWKIKYTYTSWKKKKKRERLIGKYEYKYENISRSRCSFLFYYC